MATIHFLNVLEGDCNIIQHDSNRVTVIDVSNASNEVETPQEKAVKESKARKEMLRRTQVPIGKIDYKQKETPDNPIEYLNKFGVPSIFRFILTHPDMDHMDGLRDIFQSFSVPNFWDTANNKAAPDFGGGGYNKEDWDFYEELRKKAVPNVTRHTFLSGQSVNFFDLDQLTIIAPTQGLVSAANDTGDYNDCSYVLLFTPPKSNNRKWKILFAGDSHDNTWNYILGDLGLRQELSNIDILFAPHHGRDSDRDYAFLNLLKPRVTLFGNASSKHLAYDKYTGSIRITNNQAGYVVMNVSDDNIQFYVKNRAFADSFRKKRGWDQSTYSAQFDAFELCWLMA
jgi:competence protein ComEC